MKATPHARRHGFTLVELSIVLIIIGLLVGGMLAMRSFLKNSQLSTTINEGKYFISAYNQFQQRYNAVPGDFCAVTTPTVCSIPATVTVNNVWPTAKNGDANGLIRAAGTAFPMERYYVFQHLALGGFISGTYSGATNGGTDKAAIGINVPGASIDKVAFFFDHPDAQDGNVLAADTTYFPTTTAGLYGNVLFIAGLNDPGAAATQLPDQPFLTPKEALQVDEKFDDSVPGTGTIMVPESTTNCHSGGTTYATATTSKTCYLILRFQ